MADEKLTDAQVAALTVVHAVYDDPAQVVLRDTHRGDLVSPEDVQALALEVQQARGRRCETCAHWTDEGGDQYGNCEMQWVAQGTDEGFAYICTPCDFSCADWAPKP